jgi:hypothetical protein
MKERRVGSGLLAFSNKAKETCFRSEVYDNLWLRLMPSVARRKQKNTQNAQRKEMEREKEAKKKQQLQQLPAKGKKR